MLEMRDRSLQEVSNIVHQEIENLDPRRTLTSGYKNLRNYMQTHATRLQNMMHTACLDPAIILFLAGCHSSPPLGFEHIKLLGLAVHAEVSCVQQVMHIIKYAQQSHIYQISEDAVAKYAHLNAETGALAFDVEQTFTEFADVVDEDLVVKEMHVICEAVQQLDAAPSEEVAELVKWALSSWLACVLSVCGAADISIDHKYTRVINMIPNIVSGDFPANRFAHRLADHPLSRLFFGE